MNVHFDGSTNLNNCCLLLLFLFSYYIETWKIPRYTRYTSSSNNFLCYPSCIHITIIHSLLLDNCKHKVLNCYSNILEFSVVSANPLLDSHTRMRRHIGNNKIWELHSLASSMTGILMTKSGSGRGILLIPLFNGCNYKCNPLAFTTNTSFRIIYYDVCFNIT